MAFLIFYTLTFIIVLAISPINGARAVNLTAIALALRLAVTFALPNFIILDDEIGYSILGSGVATGLAHGSASPWESNMWANFTGLLYYLIDDSWYTVRAFNSLLGVVSAFVIFRIALLLYGDWKIAETALKYALFMPPLIFLSCIAMKEMWIGFLLLLILYGCIRAGISGYSVLLAGSLMLSQFRTDLMILLVPILLIHLFVEKTAKSKISKPKRLAFAAIALIGGGALAYHLTFESDLFEGTKIAQIVRENQDQGYQTLKESTATYTEFVDVNNPNSIRNLLLLPINSIFSPSPFRIIKSPVTETFVEVFGLTIVLYWCMPMFFLGIVRSWGNNRKILAISTYFVVFIMAAYSTLTIAPEPFRYRWPSFPIFFLICAYGKGYGHRLSSFIYRAWWISVALFGGLYLSTGTS